MRIVVFYFLFVFLIVALYGFAFSMSPAEQPDGKKIFTENKCSTCHSIESEGIVRKSKIEKNIPPDLSHLSKTFTRDKLFNYLKKNETLNDKKHPANFKGTDDELKTLAKWLTGLKPKTKK